MNPIRHLLVLTILALAACATTTRAPDDGPPKDSAQGVAHTFLARWQTQSWKAMARSAQITWLSNNESPHEWLEASFGFRELLSFEIVDEKTISAVVSDVTVNVRYRMGDNEQDASMTLRLICEVAPYSPSVDGTWGVNPKTAMAR